MSARLRRIRLGRAYARSERVVARRIGSEFVLVPLAGRGSDLDSVYNLQGAAPFIWEQLDGRRSGDTIVDAIVERFEVERERAAADYVELVETMRRLGAAFPAPAPGRARRATSRARVGGTPRGARERLARRASGPRPGGSRRRR